MMGRSIKHYLLTSWMISLLVAIAGSAALSFGISYLDYSNHRQAFQSKLHEDAKTIARRVAAELLLGPNGRLKAVERDLRSDYTLSDIQVVSSTAHGTNVDSGHTLVQVPIPDVMPPASLVVSAVGPRFSDHINLKSFLFALLPILALVFAGFLIQRRLLKKYVIHPIQALADTSTGNRPVRDHWPIEIRKIAEDLAQSFSNREQAVFGQLARGLIHDIRTQINSINTALQLVEETEAGTPDRQRRIEKLQLACSRNIPKIRELLELSLDSSREVSVKETSSDFEETLRQSIQNIKDLADAKGVTLIPSRANPINFAHDRVQLERVFTNLLKNAVEAVEEGSSSLRQIQVHSDTTDSAIQVQIEDSGPGFVDAKLAFRPLKTTKTHGYGLGLFVSRKIIEAHRGNLQAGRSEILGGAKMIVTFPRKEISS